MTNIHFIPSSLSSYHWNKQSVFIHPSSFWSLPFPFPHPLIVLIFSLVVVCLLLFSLYVHTFSLPHFFSYAELIHYSRYSIKSPPIVSSPPPPPPSFHRAVVLPSTRYTLQPLFTIYFHHFISISDRDATHDELVKILSVLKVKAPRIWSNYEKALRIYENCKILAASGSLG